MDFKSGQQLIGLCETNECPISEIMLIREETFTERTRKDIINQMGKTWQIMKEKDYISRIIKRLQYKEKDTREKMEILEQQMNAYMEKILC